VLALTEDERHRCLNSSTRADDAAKSGPYNNTGQQIGSRRLTDGY
jgi:hypothetical protein